MQEGRRAAYFNQVLSPKAQCKLVYERDLMAIVLTVKKGKAYLLGNEFMTCIDQQSLK